MKNKTTISYYCLWQTSTVTQLSTTFIHITFVQQNQLFATLPPFPSPLRIFLSAENLIKNPQCSRVVSLTLTINLRTLSLIETDKNTQTHTIVLIVYILIYCVFC